MRVFLIKPAQIRLFLAGLLLLLAPFTGADTDPLAQQRALYTEAERELRSGAGPRYRALRQQLDDYPLTIYLDYDHLRDRLRKATAAEALAWLARAEGSPLENRLREAWISDHGRRERWQALLAVQPQPPRDERLQCFYYRAKLATGAREQAMAAAARLWNVGKSQDRACDPLFSTWFTESGPDDALVWSRALKAFDARSVQLLSYLTRFASPELLPLVQELYAVYRRPDRLLRDQHRADPRHAQLTAVGIRRLARVNPEQALAALERARGVQPFSDQQLQAMERMIVRHSLFTQSSAPDPWIAETLDRLRDDELTEIYLRNQLRDSHWGALLEGVEWLSPAKREEDMWRYWRARALAEAGQAEAAADLRRALAQERSFHGFLAAEQQSLPYQLNERPLQAVGSPVDDPGLARVRELMALDRLSQARGEWQSLLLRVDEVAQRDLAGIARAEGWSSLSIVATNVSRSWDALDWRFPWLYRGEFESAAVDQGLPPGELVAIARRESALYPRAVSSAGAMGLMQLMPGTARQVARKAGVRYRRSSLLQADYNIGLGARYYGQLKARFDDLRPMALAAYNAGPHRVDRWSVGDLPVDQWIDSLPFYETREYVRAVLAYALIYRLRDGESATLFSEHERSFRY